MEKPDKLMGYVKYKDTFFPFDFNEERFEVTLYPPTIEKWEETSSPKSFLSSLNQDYKKHEWIKNGTLRGTTSDRRNIIFNIQESCVNYHGFCIYRVNWYFYYSIGMSDKNISGFRITGDEVEYFYPSKKVLKQRIEYDDVNVHNLKKISVDAIEQIIESGGKYRVAKNVDASLEVSSYAVAHFDNNKPISAKSTFTTIFSKPVNLDTLIDAYLNTVCFFEYITYRKNISFDNFSVYYLNNEGKRDYAGLLVFRKTNKVEDDKNVSNRIIQYSQLKTKVAKIFTAIKNNKLVFQHLCESISETHKYSASRVIMIFSAFEREYRNLYGQDCNRSIEYLKIKEEVVDLIGKYIMSKSGKERAYAKQLQKYVKNRDNSFELNLKNALLDCIQIMKPFINNKYYGTEEKNIDSLCERMGEIRNGIAHSKLELKFDAIHLSDIRIVEELLYAMRLKNMKIKDKDIQRAICNVFKENVFI